jgi:hypothetical protein
METKIAEVIRLAYLITKQGNYTFFVDYYGHTDCFSIRRCKGKWNSEIGSEKFREIFMNEIDAEEKLESLINELKQLYESR